ncbi:STAS-like domain-containing protein [Enterococcus asini]|uniref:STAS-like domain-containing protein n=1 Tax=Enterococcus asini TaxID=57732 RepID=UPI002D80CBEF|nr:STAS-like domain-containing protein [Enterococcus asini]MCD5029240.1 STAS-like domain-containing protein [Enterococcus asini]
MVTIIVNQILSSCVTNDDGDVLYNEIKAAFGNGEKVRISFQGIFGLNSSFVNSAFIQLLEDYDFDFIKKHLMFTDSNKQINGLILSRFRFETEKCIV